MLLRVGMDHFADLLHTTGQDSEAAGLEAQAEAIQNNLVAENEPK